MINRGGGKQRGVVLVMALWLMLAMSLLAMSFSASIRTEVNAARNDVDLKESYYLARAGIEYAIYKIVEAQMAFAASRARQTEGLGAVPEALTGFVELPLGAGRAEVEIGDETGKLNVNMAPDYLLYNLLVVIGLGEEAADRITDSILDWRDPDDLHRLNGAESDYYQSLPTPYLAKNGIFDVPEELLLVQGVTPEIYYGRKGITESGQEVEYYGLQKFLTTFTRISRINVNSAPIEVLLALPGVEYDAAVQIQQMREGSLIMNTTQIMENIPGLPTDSLGLLSTVRSNIYFLTSNGVLDDSQVVSRIRSVVRLEPTSPKGYSVLYWNESNLEL